MHIAEGAVWLGLGAAAILVLVTRREDMGSVLASAAGIVVAAQQGVRRAVRMCVERERIRAEYIEQAKVPPRTDTLAKMEGGTRSESGWAALLIAGFMAVAAGVTWVLADRYNFWPLLVVVVVGVGILGLALDGVRRLGKRARSIPTLAGTPEPPDPRSS